MYISWGLPTTLKRLLSAGWSMSSNSFLSCADTRVCNYVCSTNMYSQINIFIEFSCFNRRNNNTTTKRQLEQFAESDSESKSMSESELTLCLVFYDLDFLLWHTTCHWRWPIASNNNDANKRQQQRETTRRHLQVTLAELMSRQKCDRCCRCPCPKKNSSPAALWLIPSNWSRSLAGCLWLPLAINTYSFGYGYRRVWGITTRTSQHKHKHKHSCSNSNWNWMK